MSFFSKLYTKTKPTTPWLMIGLTAFILAVAIAAGAYVLLGNRGVTIDLYGPAVDPTIMQLEQTLTLLKNKFPSTIHAVNFHFVANYASGQPSSFLLNNLDKPTEQQQAIGQLDLDEAKRQLWIQQHYSRQLATYLSVRNLDLINGSWQLAASFANIPTDKVEAALTDGSAEKLLRQESDQLEKVRAKLDPRLNLLPYLLFNGELYRGRADLISLSTQVAKLVLRHGRSSLPTKTPISLFGGRLTIAPFRHYLVNNIPEGYTDADCQDNPRQNGHLENAGTSLAHCAYTEASVVHLKIYTNAKDYAPEKDGLVFNVEQDIKGLNTAVTALDDATKDDLTKTIKDLKLDDKLADLENAPYYIFEPDLQKDVLSGLYTQAKLVFQLPDGRFLLNRLAL